MDIKIANRLTEVRKNHGMSQGDLADKLGVSRQAVSKWERGESSPDIDKVFALADIYCTSLDELLGYEKKEAPEAKVEAAPAPVAEPVVEETPAPVVEEAPVAAEPEKAPEPAPAPEAPKAEEKKEAPVFAKKEKRGFFGLFRK